MRRIDLRTELHAPARRAWEVLTDTDAWPQWGRLVTSARGELEPGARWTMTLRGRDGGGLRQMRPRLVDIEAPRRIAFETLIGGGWVVRILHTFVLEPDGPDRATLLQSFEITGLLVAPLWRPVRRGVVQFAELGEDLARRLAM